MNKVSEGDGIPAELLQILKDDAVKSAALNIPANMENSAVARGQEKISFPSIPKKGNAKESSNQTTAFISYTSKTTLKTVQAMFQQYVNQELPDRQAGFTKGRGMRYQITNIH